MPLPSLCYVIGASKTCMTDVRKLLLRKEKRAPGGHTEATRRQTPSGRGRIAFPYTGTSMRPLPGTRRPIPMESSVSGNSLAMYLKWFPISTPPLRCQCRKCRPSMINSLVSQLNTQSKARRPSCSAVPRRLPGWA